MATEVEPQQQAPAAAPHECTNCGSVGQPSDSQMFFSIGEGSQGMKHSVECASCKYWNWYRPHRQDKQAG